MKETERLRAILPVILSILCFTGSACAGAANLRYQLPKKFSWYGASGALPAPVYDRAMHGFWWMPAKAPAGKGKTLWGNRGYLFVAGKPAAPEQVAKAEAGRTIPESVAPAAEKRLTPPNPVFKSIHFAFNRYYLNSRSRTVLKGISRYLFKHPKVDVLVEGNCDERGTEAYNLVLGEHRALSARSFLIDLGVAPQRLFTVSYGKDRPVNPAHNPVAWAENRRDDFKTGQR